MMEPREPSWRSYSDRDKVATIAPEIQRVDPAFRSDEDARKDRKARGPQLKARIAWTAEDLEQQLPEGLPERSGC
jgi:hypothetical protein